MNKAILIGRLTRDVETRYTQGNEPMAISRYTLAVDRKYKREGEPEADFINCVAFEKAGEFAEKYFHKGMKVAVSGRIQTGNYTNKDGVKVYTTDIIVDEQEFCESKGASAQGNAQQPSNTPSSGDEFMDIPEGFEDELPFN